jgi:superfamily II DNA/RNA helicase
MNHVIHYHLPSKEDEFTHRNGRTARMLAKERPMLLLMRVRKMDYINYGMEVLKWKVLHCQNLRIKPFTSGGKKK